VEHHRADRRSRPQPGKNPFASLPAYPSSVTAAVYDAVSGKTYFLHPGVTEDTASIASVEIMGTLLHQAQAAGAPLPGTELSLMTSMIEASDDDSATQLLVRSFAYSNGVLNSTNRNYGIGLMTHVEADQDWGVSGSVGDGTTVALKNGWLPLDVAGNSNWQVNSIGTNSSSLTVRSGISHFSGI
jgi:hypothetical protein